MSRLMKSLIFVASLLAYPALATPVTCDVSNATLTSIKAVAIPPETDLGPELLVNSYTASSCVGVFEGANDDGGLSEPDPNIGQLNDGLLNGQGDLFDGMEFITVADLQDLDGDGNATDPGWIHLAGFNPEPKPENGEVMYDYSMSGPSPSAPDLQLDIEDLLTLTFTCTDSDGDGCLSYDWELATKLDVIGQVQQLLGEATFDHLAFSIKAGTAFAVYDFDFKEIFANELVDNPESELNFLTPYVLAGTLDTGDFCETKVKPNGRTQEVCHAISHLNVWARDPADSTEIPEPSVPFIFGLGLLGLGLLRSRPTK